MGTVDGRTRGEYMMIFPYMAKGHTIPLLHLTSALSARGVAVTIVTTLGNLSFVRQSFPPNANPNVDVVVLPFPRHPSLPDGCESTEQLLSFDLIPDFLQATELIRRPFGELLSRLSESGSLPLCVISDFFLGWTLDECRRFNLPRVVFHGMGVFAMLLCKILSIDRPHLAAAAGGEDAFYVPGTPQPLLLTHADVPDSFLHLDSPFDNFFPLVIKNAEAELDSWGLLVNSFQELEGEYVPHLEAYYRSGSARAWLAGPLCLHNRPATVVSGGARDPCLAWLDGRPTKAVLYVSFGTQAQVSAEQMEEVATGCEMSGHDFLLVSRTPVAAALSGRGLVIHGRVPQIEVLMHPSTGGFLSHCGWNSVMEGLSAGVPFLAWPMVAEQALNARMVAGELGAGLRVGACAGGLSRRDEICKWVKELMGGGEEGKRVRKKAEELGKMAMAAVTDGGSSASGLTQFVEEIRRTAKICGPL